MENADFSRILQSIPLKLYCNGFTIGVGSSDVTVVLNLSGTNTGVINMSYTSAKTLAQNLAKAIEDFEAKTGVPIMTSQFIQEKITPKLEQSDAEPNESV